MAAYWVMLFRHSLYGKQFLFTHHTKLQLFYPPIETPLNTVLLDSPKKETNNSQYFGLNISYSGIKYTEKDWVRLKVWHYPFQTQYFITEYQVFILGIVCPFPYKLQQPKTLGEFQAYKKTYKLHVFMIYMLIKAASNGSLIKAASNCW